MFEVECARMRPIKPLMNAPERRRPQLLDHLTSCREQQSLTGDFIDELRQIAPDAVNVLELQQLYGLKRGEALEAVEEELGVKEVEELLLDWLY